MVGLVFVVAVRRHGPHGILKTHWRSLVRSRVEGLKVPPLVDDGNHELLFGEVELMPVVVTVLVFECTMEGWLVRVTACRLLTALRSTRRAGVSRTVRVQKAHRRKKDHQAPEKLDLLW